MFLVFRFLIFLLCIHIAEQCGAKKEPERPPPPAQAGGIESPKAQEVDSLCLACSNFLTQIKTSIPKRLDALLDGFQTFAQLYLPYYSSIGSYVDDYPFAALGSLHHFMGEVDRELVSNGYLLRLTNRSAHHHQHRLAGVESPKVQEVDSLCLACSNFLTQIKTSIPKRLDALLDGFQTFAQLYLPYYSSIGSYVDDYPFTALRAVVRLLLRTIHPQGVCTQFLMC
ncbi:hypothetical protein OSTOST_05345 [Ostertagia ostertagi]